MNKDYFLLINQSTGDKLICSWWENEPAFFGQKVHYIGVTGGLGGLKTMLAKGYVFKHISKRMKEVLANMVSAVIGDLE